MAKFVYLLAVALPTELRDWVSERHVDIGFRRPKTLLPPHLTLVARFRCAYQEDVMVGVLGGVVREISTPFVTIKPRIFIESPRERPSGVYRKKFALLAVESSAAQILSEIRRQLVRRMFRHFYPVDPALFSMLNYQPHITIKRNLTDEERAILSRNRLVPPVTTWSPDGIVIYRINEAGRWTRRMRLRFASHKSHSANDPCPSAI